MSNLNERSGDFQILQRLNFLKKIFSSITCSNSVYPHKTLPQLLIDEHRRMYNYCDGYYTQFNTYTLKTELNVNIRPSLLWQGRDLGGLPFFFRKCEIFRLVGGQRPENIVNSF